MSAGEGLPRKGEDSAAQGAVDLGVTGLHPDAGGTASAQTSGSETDVLGPARAGGEAAAADPGVTGIRRTSDADSDHTVLLGSLPGPGRTEGEETPGATGLRRAPDAIGALDSSRTVLLGPQAAAPPAADWDLTTPLQRDAAAIATPGPGGATPGRSASGPAPAAAPAPPSSSRGPDTLVRPGPRQPASAVSGGADGSTVLSGRYRLDELLGQGGMGLVFRATDLRMPGVQVAIKLLKPALLQAQPELLSMLQESVRKSRLLPHPNIASIYSLEADGTNDFVVMELLQGQTLQSLLDGEYARGLPVALARRLIVDLCAALAYAHDHAVVHSDIKPSNIFVTPAGRAKLFDFDVARVVRGPTGYFDPGSVRAVTFAYASIEMVQGDKPDPRDDVYALACVIHEMLTGRHPFGGASALTARAQDRQAARLAVLGEHENRVLAEALCFERERRLPGVEALQKAFAPAPGTMRFALPGAGLSSKLSSWLPRSRRGQMALGFAGTLACTVVAWTLLSPSPQPAAPSPRETPPSPLTVELDRAQALALRATALAIDIHDETLQHAVAQLSAARAEHDPANALQLAQAANLDFQAAIARSPRSAQLGTSDTQLAEALQLCRQLRLRCAAKDLADEAPRWVSLRPFEIDAQPVTNGEFAGFVQATGHRTAAEIDGQLFVPDAVNGWDTVAHGQSWRTVRAAALTAGGPADSLPVLAMDLESARAYCRWKGKRLPGEDEWEYTARGPAAQVFPWGDQPVPPVPLPARAVALDGTALPASPRGLGGNVAEWTETRIAGQRVLRGGSWLLPQPFFQRLALRRNPTTSGAAMDSSFRCAASLESWPDGVQDPAHPR
jgi:serine/threonine protein kinase